MNAVITGATKGIGKALSELFAKNGLNLCLCARSENDLQELRSNLNKINPKVSVFIKACDLSQKSQVIEFGNYCLEKLNEIDILVNNAGIFLPGNIYNEPDGLLEDLVNINLYSAYHLTRSLVPSMIANKKGHIFNLCSVASINAYDMGGSYAITKFALLGFSKNLRHELKEFGIRVTAVLPGAVFTPSWEGTTQPESRFIPAEDIASLIWNAYEVSDRTVVEELLIRPLLGDL